MALSSSHLKIRLSSKVEALIALLMIKRILLDLKKCRKRCWSTEIVRNGNLQPSKMAKEKPTREKT